MANQRDQEDELFEEKAPASFRDRLSILGSVADAEDMGQETFLRGQKIDLSKIKSASTISNWRRTIRLFRTS